jgi:hypothetical protein
MAKERADFDFGSDDAEPNIDLSSVIKASRSIDKKHHVSQKDLEYSAQESGFSSRDPQKIQRSKRRSPYVIQTNLKTRIGMKELMHHLSDQLGIYDQETFELGLEALMEKHNMSDLLRKFQHLRKDS